MKLRWLGNMERMQEKRMPNNLLHGHIIGMRKKRRPRKRWLQVIDKDMGRMEIRGQKWKRQVDKTYGGGQGSKLTVEPAQKRTHQSELKVRTTGINTILVGGN